MKDYIIGFFIGALFVISLIDDFERVKNVDDNLVIEHKGKVYVLQQIKPNNFVSKTRGNK